jgi:predicted permease
VIVLNSILPVFGLVFLGAALKHFRLTNDEFLATSDRLIYFVFFPLMLFWKIGGASSIAIDWPFCAACLCALFCIYLLSWICIKIFRITDFQAGTFSQSCYRFNTYIGMAIIMTAVGESGVGVFGILIGIMIPIINVLAVSTLIWYSGKTYSAGARNRMILKALISNPLILGCAAGLVAANLVDSFPVFIDNTLQLAGMVTLPLALLSIGGNLTFSSFKEYYRQSLIGAMIKLVALPLIGYLFFNLFNVVGLSLKVGMIFFTLPTSTAIYVLSSQLKSDTRLASASIVISTVLSFFSLSIALLLIGKG